MVEQSLYGAVNGLYGHVDFYGYIPCVKNRTSIIVINVFFRARVRACTRAIYKILFKIIYIYLGGIWDALFMRVFGFKRGANGTKKGGLMVR